MRIAVIALGKIGLPLAVQYASRGHDVVGVDVSDRVVDAVRAGIEPFPGEADLGTRLAHVVAAGRLRATTDYAEAVPGADVVVVVVPLIVDGEARPDFSLLDESTDSIAAHLTPSTLVLYETTLPVGTTRNRWRPRLEAGSGLSEGRDFHLAYSPERVLSGRIFADLRRYPKLIGGLDEEGARKTRDFYEQVLEFDHRPDLARPNGVWDLGSADAAEFAKLAETTYRDVNIGLANQFARFADRSGIDIFQVIEASNSQPYSHIHRPGIAVGGHCIPVYPRLYLWNDPQASIVSAAREANAAMPDYAVGVLEGAHGDLRGQRVAVLGAAYRGGVKELAFSGVFDLVRGLKQRGAHPVVHDPLFPDHELGRVGFEAFHRGETADAVVVQADHSEYGSWTYADVPNVRTVIDGRHILDARLWTPALLRSIGDGGHASVRPSA